MPDVRITTLVQALSNRHPDVREKAARTLGELKSHDALEPLATAAQDVNAAVRRAAVLALGELDDPRSVEPIARVLLQDSDPKVRQYAALAFIPSDRGKGEVFTRSGAVEPLIRALGDGSAMVRKQSAEALGFIPDPRSVEPLARLFADKGGEEGSYSYYPNQAATDSLKKLAAAIPEVVVDVMLWKALAKKNLDMQLCAAKVLGEAGDPRAVQPLRHALQNVWELDVNYSEGELLREKIEFALEKIDAARRIIS